MTRRVAATGIAATAVAVVMRNLISAQSTPEASPVAEQTPTLLLRIQTQSPMLPQEVLTSVPEFSLFDDGSIYALGPQLAIFPPPALPNLTVTKVTLEAAQSLVAAARTAGLDEPRELESSSVLADAPRSFITLFDGEQEIVSSAAGLMILMDQPNEWDDETWENFLELRSIASLLIGWSTTIDAAAIVSPERSIEPDRLQMAVFTSTNSFAAVSGVPNIEQPALIWPLAIPLSALAGDADESLGIAESACSELVGDDLATLLDVIATGDLQSPWVDAAADDSVLYGILFKPLLPDQSACAF